MYPCMHVLSLARLYPSVANKDSILFYSNCDTDRRRRSDDGQRTNFDFMSSADKVKQNYIYNLSQV